MMVKAAPIFKPAAVKTKAFQLGLRLEPAQMAKLEDAVQRSGVSKQAFCAQAIMFAIDHMDLK